MARFRLTPWRIAIALIFILLLASYLARVWLLNLTLKQVAPPGWQIQVGAFELSLFNLELGTVDINAEAVGHIRIGHLHAGGIDRFRFTSAILNDFFIENIEYEAQARRINLQALQMHNLRLSAEMPGIESVVIRSLVLEDNALQLQATLENCEINDVRVKLKEEQPVPDVSLAQLALHNLQAGMAGQNLQLESLNLMETVFADQALSFAELNFARLELTQPQPAADLRVGHLLLSDQRLELNTEFSPESLVLNEVVITDISTTVDDASTGAINSQLAAVSLRNIEISGLNDKVFVGVSRAAIQGLQSELFNAQTYFSLSSLAVDDIHFQQTPQNLEIAQVELVDMYYAPDTEAGKKRMATQFLFSLPTLLIKQLSYKPDLSAVAMIDMQGGRLVAALDKQGRVNLVPAEPAAAVTDAATEEAAETAATGQAEAPETAAEPEKASGYFALQAFQLSRPFSITFTDNSQAKPVEIHAAITSIRLEQVSSDPTAPDGRLKVVLNVEGHSDIEISASMNPGKTTDFAIASDIKHLELMAVSPYAEIYTGYAINAGQMDLDLQVDAKSNQLKGEAKIVLRKIDMATVDSEMAGSLQQQLTMPLPTALAILKDRKGNIELDVPIEGDLNDPSFGLGDLINTLTMKALKAVTFTYLKKSLLPTSLVLDAASLFAGSIYEQMTALPPIAFTKGTAQYAPDNQTVVENVATMMKEKGSVTLKICAVVALDEAATPELRQALAGQREELVKSTLIGGGIHAERLMKCKAKTDDASLGLVYLPMN